MFGNHRLQLHGVAGVRARRQVRSRAFETRSRLRLSELSMMLCGNLRD
jgi:hypothetical protein